MGLELRRIKIKDVAFGNESKIEGGVLTLNAKELEDLVLEQKGAMERVIQFKPHELLTEERLVPWQNTPGLAPGVSLEQDIVKAAVFERHLHT